MQAWMEAEARGTWLAFKQPTLLSLSSFPPKYYSSSHDRGALWSNHLLKVLPLN
jgi:hypothetical protein